MVASYKVPPYQTKVNLYERMKNKTHWSDLYKKIRHSLMRYYTKEFILKESWAIIELNTHTIEILQLFIM